MIEVDPATLESSFLWHLCARLIALDTVSTNSSLDAAFLVANELDLPGWTVQVHEDHALGASKGSVIALAGPAEPGGLMLSGHLDTVPYASQPGWTRDALELGRDDTRLYGRGIADMKGFIAQCVVLAKALDPSMLRVPLALVFTSDEEVGCLGSGRLVDQFPALFGSYPVPDRGVIGEPTDFRVMGAHKGHVQCVVRVQGSGGHSSRPDLGANAIFASAHVLAAIESVAASYGQGASEAHHRLFPDFPGIAFNAGMIRGGSAVNMIPEICEIHLGFRPRPGDDVNEILASIERAARASLEGPCLGPPPGVALDEILMTPPMHPAPEGLVADVLRDLSGTQDFLGAPFATDGGQFERAGVRSYIWGPGELSQAHQPNESMPIASFLRMPPLLEQLVLRTCCTRQPP